MQTRRFKTLKQSKAGLNTKSTIPNIKQTIPNIKLSKHTIPKNQIHFNPVCKLAGKTLKQSWAGLDRFSRGTHGSDMDRGHHTARQQNEDNDMMIIMMDKLFFVLTTEGFHEETLALSW